MGMNCCVVFSRACCIPPTSTDPCRGRQEVVREGGNAAICELLSFGSAG